MPNDPRHGAAEFCHTGTCGPKPLSLNSDEVICSVCEALGRQVPATETLGGRPCCACHFRYEIEDPNQ